MLAALYVKKDPVQGKRKGSSITQKLKVSIASTAINHGWPLNGLWMPAIWQQETYTKR